MGEGSVCMHVFARQSFDSRNHNQQFTDCEMATLVYAHGIAILTNRGPSKFVAEHIFYALQI